jgi:tetratricopeptide (TPR) repeat protein
MNNLRRFRMSVLNSPIVRALGLSAAVAGLAGAQGAPKSCDVNESRPTAVGKATLSVQVATSATPEAAARRLTDAVRTLTDNGEKMDNQPGRNFVLGKALVLWSMQPNVELVTKRGPLGYTSDPTGTIDLGLAIDSAFKVVETSNPECITETARWRGQKAWINMINKAIERLNSEDPDSAELVARRAILLNPYAPYGYVVLANVMQKRNKSTEAFDLYKKSIEMAARDTAYDDIRRQSLVYLGNLATDSAEMAPDAAAKRPYVETARAAYDQLMKDKNAGDFAANARAGLCRIAIVTGDTASLRTTYKEPLAAPGTFTYGDLMNAGVCMARAEMVSEATILFQAAYEKNPYHRDALSNLSIMLLRSDLYDRSIPLAQRLVAVEPNNPENLQLLVLSYAGIAKRARDTRLAANKPTATKTATKTGSKTAPAKPATPPGPRLSLAASDSLFKLEKAYTDSAVTINEKKERLALKVQLSDFSTNEEKSTVSGTITNQASAATKDSVTVHVDFLGKDGTVITSKETKVQPLAPGKSTRFTVTVNPGKGISAFRYTIG